MALDSYTGLVEEVGAWLNKGTALNARIPTFIRLTESRLNKLLDDPEMEVTATSIATGATLALPSDFGSLRSIRIGDRSVRQGTAAAFAGFPSVGGNPTTYGLIDGQLSFAPSPATGSAVTLVYKRRIPNLSAETPTNWLLEQAPETYLYGCILQAELYGFNDERLPTIKAFYDDAVQALKEDGANRRWGGAPLAPRIGRT